MVTDINKKMHRKYFSSHVETLEKTTALLLFLKWANPGLFYSFFSLFKQTSLEFLQQKYVKNFHPVNGAGIQTHDLPNLSLFL